MQHDHSPFADTRHIAEPKPDAAKRIAAGLDMPSDLAASGKVLRPDRVDAWEDMSSRFDGMRGLH
jgi:hypothetical protein